MIQHVFPLVENDCIGRFYDCIEDPGYQTSKRFNCANYSKCMRESGNGIIGSAPAPAKVAVVAGNYRPAPPAPKPATPNIDFDISLEDLL